MKLSQFKSCEVSRKMRISNEDIIVEGKAEIDDTVTFYEINMERLHKCDMNVISQLSLTDSNDLFMFKLIPYLSDVEVDVTFEEYVEMMKNTNVKFSAFMQEIVIGIGEMFDMLDTLKNAKDASENVSKIIAKKVGKAEAFEDMMDKMVVEKNAEKSKADEIESLYDSLLSVTDREEIKSIHKKIFELENEK